MLGRICIAALAAAGSALAAAVPFSHLAHDTQEEAKISLQGVMNNLGPTGFKAPGAAGGVFVASPSTVNPNYFYTWTRDSALTFKMLVDEFISGQTSLQSSIEDYIKAQAIIQTINSPSGSLSTGRGLGEPKFYVNETRFLGSWGRPQRDGPALRASTLIAYVRWLLDNDKKSEAIDTVWPVIKNDLAYVAQYWNYTGFDLWEEVKGSSFFASAVQHRALVEGATIAKTLGLSCPDCESQAPQILCFMQSFWNGTYQAANINVENGRSNIDANTVIASITTFDPDADCDDTTFQPCSARALANLKVYVDSFRTTYQINNGIASTAPVATGRYPEDVYFNGNPWYLCTVAVAEQLYDALIQWNARGTISITNVDLPFWQQIYSAAKVGQYQAHTDTFSSLIAAVQTYADGFVDIANKYTPADGSLTEQFNKTTGVPTSATDLTWSYAAYVTMFSKRTITFSGKSSGQNKALPASWGSRDANTPPCDCVGSSVPGTYTPAVSAGAPPNTNAACYVTMLFRAFVNTSYGENVYITGDNEDLGGWNLADAFAFSPNNFTVANPLWYVEIDLPAASNLVYTLVRQGSEGGWIYDGANQTLNTPSCGTSEQDAVVSVTWTDPPAS